MSAATFGPLQPVRLVPPGEAWEANGCNTGDCTHAHRDDCTPTLPRAASIDDFMDGRYGGPDVSGRLVLFVDDVEQRNVVAYDVDAGVVRVVRDATEWDHVSDRWPTAELRGRVSLYMHPEQWKHPR